VRESSRKEPKHPGEPPAPSRFACSETVVIASGTTDYSGATASELHGLPFDKLADEHGTPEECRTNERTPSACGGKPCPGNKNRAN
jgi:hypothetical protein